MLYNYKQFKCKHFQYRNAFNKNNKESETVASLHVSVWKFNWR